MLCMKQGQHQAVAAYLHRALMSVPSEPGCQMPITLNPRMLVYVSHRVSRWLAVT
jgi:hypothetical protein